MGFRFANVAGRAALVDGDGRWYDAEQVSGGTVAADPMAAIAEPTALAAAATQLDPAAAGGTLARSSDWSRAQLTGSTAVIGVSSPHSSTRQVPRLERVLFSPPSRPPIAYDPVGGREGERAGADSEQTETL